MGKAKRAARRAGRKGDPGAKRRQTTRRGQGRAAIDQGTDELRAKRRAISGDADIGFDFPLDVLLARGRISADQRDEGLRFCQLWWWRYGRPHASCEAIYERWCSGVVGDDFVRLEVSDEQNLARVRSQKERLARMEEALRKAGALAAAKRCAPFLQLPRSARELALLVAGLEALVVLRDAEDRNWRRHRLSRPAISGAAG